MEEAPMTSGSSLRKPLLWLIAASFPLGAFCQTVAPGAFKIAPVPGDSSELVTGQPQVAATPASREAALQLLARARNTYQLRNAGQPWDLKVRFTVDSAGQTNYDGDWRMEDLFA